MRLDNIRGCCQKQGDPRKNNERCLNVLHPWVPWVIVTYAGAQLDITHPGDFVGIYMRDYTWNIPRELACVLFINARTVVCRTRVTGDCRTVSWRGPVIPKGAIIFPNSSFLSGDLDLISVNGSRSFSCRVSGPVEMIFTVACSFFGVQTPFCRPCLCTRCPRSCTLESDAPGPQRRNLEVVWESLITCINGPRRRRLATVH